MYSGQILFGPGDYGLISPFAWLNNQITTCQQQREKDEFLNNLKMRLHLLQTYRGSLLEGHLLFDNNINR